MFHLFTHAFFKALLFLGRRFGDPRHARASRTCGTWAVCGSHMPAHLCGHDHRHHRASPAWACRPASSSASRASIPRTRSSRAAYASAASGHSAIGLFAFFVGIIAACLTAYYSWRLVFMTFHNKPVWKEEGDAHHA